MMRKLMNKFGGGMKGAMADMAGRAMKNRTDDKMGRAMVAPPTRINRPVEPEVAYKKGGAVKDSKAMAKKEIAFMKKKGAPKSMIKHEKAEYGMKKGVKKMSAGGSFRSAADGVASKGKTKGKMVKMRYGGEC
jgi:hypothetical protein